MASLSLRQRALMALSRREYSRVELKKKLAAHSESEAELEDVLDVLERDRLLSNERFAQSLVHRRGGRFGARRIELEMGQHELSSEIQAIQIAALRSSEFARCKSVWEKRFGTLPEDVNERARQARFLSGRGFDPGVIYRVLKGHSED